ncbi:MAG: murein hydrolase activator EnvC family protein [Pseudomonadota bacterium]
MQASTSAQSERTTSGIEVSELDPSSQPAPEPATIDGNSYEVQEGDTLFSISNATQTRLTELVDLNELEPPYELSPGERLRLPERSQQTESQQREPSQQEVTQEQEPTSDLASEDSAAETESGESVEERTETQAPDMSQPESSDIPVAAETGPISDPPALTGQGFSWPLQGEILSRYGAQGDGRHNDGINIAVSEGTVVRASENGVVAYAGNELRGFGNLLLVRHQDGWVTAYGHNSRLLVGRGAEVKRGQPIAEAGNSGSVSRPQLHFEIRKGTRAMDPLELLEE